MFRGTMTALATPFRDGRVDEAALRALVVRQLEKGIHGLVACGTTGEAAAMSLEERLQVVRLVKEVAAGRVPVIAGSGGNNTAVTVETTRRLGELGVDGVLVVTPFYVKPTQAGLLEHFAAVAEVGVPVVAYNVPGRTGVSLSADSVAALARLPNLVALKEATGDMRFAAQLRRLVPGDFALLSGDDFTYLPFLALGGNGCISVVSNIDPGRMAQVYDRFAAGDLAEARALFLELLPLAEVLFLESNPIPVKAALGMLGLFGPEIRLPLTPLAASNRPRLQEVLDALGLLPDGEKS